MPERRYAKSHEWVALEGETATVGISEYAVEQLGDVVYVDLPAAGKHLNSGDVIGDIESVKAVSQVYSPISGDVIEANDALTQQPETVNASPLEKGWLVKLNASQADEEYQSLMDEAHYQAFTADQS